MKNLYQAFFLALLFCAFTNTAAAAGHTVILSPVNASCFNSCSGSITSTVTGGTGPYSYLWMPGNLTTANISSLCAGSYTVTVTDQADGSTATASVTILQPTQITAASTNIVNASCNVCNGSATMAVSGGTPPYSYMWMPAGGNTPTLSNVCAGTYTFLITDAQGCSGVTAVTINNLPGPTLSTQASPATICTGNSTVLTPTITGGNPPFTYMWSPANSLSNANAASPTATPTVTTTYTLSVADASGCTVTRTVTVTVNQAVAATVSSTDPTCNQSNGSLTVNVTQAAPPYTILWSNAQTTPTISSLPAGLYSVLITDNNGCSLNLSSGLNNVGGPSLSTSVINAGCTNASNGSATVSATGISPFTYLWNTTPAQTTATATGLAGGSHMVSVTDGVGCVTTASVAVNALAGNLFLYAQQTAAANCNTSTGSATTFVSGGTPPYAYLWSNSAVTSSISNAPAGLYTVNVSDANGCSTSGFAYIHSYCANYLYGRVYIDVNQDGVYNAGDYPVQGAIVGTAPLTSNASTQANGNYQNWIPSAGSFNVSVSGVGPYLQLASPVSGFHTVNFPALNDTALADFVFTVQSPVQDLYLSLASGAARPGFTQHYTIYCQNVGTTVVSDTIWFRHDSILTLNSATPAFDGYTYPQGYWAFSNLAPGGVITKTVWMQVPTIPNGGYIGRILNADAHIGPIATDYTPADNSDTEVDVITASYDPNLKECWSPTMNSSGDIWPSDITLDYTIHFQNTGTDTAFTVVVVDTLPAQLDVTTFRIGASSHPCTYSLNGTNGINVATFTFMNILLPDSTVNEAASHGYVQFTIDRYPNLPVGTQIINEANNYFDFNPAIVTNQSVVTIASPLVVDAHAAASAHVYPNPAQERVNVVLGSAFAGSNATITLRDITGRELTSVQCNGSTTVTLDTQGFASGLYFISVVSAGHETITQQLIISGK